jgi:hypothetical protein
MVSNYANCVSKVICIDLLNSSWEDIHNFCLISNAANGLKMYLKHLYNTLHNDLFDRSNPHLIYIENDYVIGTKRYQTNVTQFMLGGLEILPDTSVDKLDKSIFSRIENELVSTSKLVFSDSIYDLFNNHYSYLLQSKKYDTIFLDAHIEVSKELVLSYDELCSKFNLSIAFLNCKNRPKTSEFVLHKMYFKNSLPIVFVFKNPDGLEFMGWNRHFLLSLKEVEPVDLSFVDRKATLNYILDKINLKGLKSLSCDEISFLDSYSKS